MAIARALVHEPSVIFADEPTRALDSTSREEIMGLLQKLNGQGMTIVVATSDSGIANYCRRVVRIAEGRTQDSGPVTKQRIISQAKVPGSAPRSHQREVTVCPRCSYGNFQDQELCSRCQWPLQLTQDEEQSIEGRLGGAEGSHLGVESSSDDGEVPGQELAEELGDVPVFGGLGTKSLVKLMAALEQQSFIKGSNIVVQGEEGDAFYIVRSGQVEVQLEAPGQPASTLAELGPKEGFGEMALLTDQPRSASVVATTDVEVWRLPKEAFAGLISETPFPCPVL